MPIATLGLSYNPLTGKCTVTSSSGQTAVVAAVAGKKIVVLSALVSTDTTQTVYFQSGSTAITATHPVIASGGFCLPFNPCGWFEADAGSALNFYNSISSNCGVTITYILV